MYWFEYAGVVLGLVWLFCIMARLPAMALDTRIFWRSLRALQYQGSWAYLTVMWFIIPGVLGAPLMIWVDRWQAFRVTAAPSIYQVAIEACYAYGPEHPFPEPEVEEEEPAAPPSLAALYFRSLNPDDEAS